MKSWSNTAENRKAAKAWAKGFSEVREQAPSHSPTQVRATLREIWERYKVAEFHTLRPRTQQNYSERWQEWERFAGRDFIAEDTTLEMIDDLRAARVKLGLSINQTAETIKVIKLVFRWAQRRELILRNRVVLYRFKVSKEERRTGVEEYQPDDFRKLLAQLDPRNSREWRAWAITAICGTQGARINAVLHVRWEDVGFDEGRVIWRKEWDKMGHEREQPLTSLAREAFFVALGWSLRDRTESGWVFYTPTQKKRERGDHIYHVSSYWRMLRTAEDNAGIAHVKQRAAHGLRRMAAGNVLQLTNNPVVAMQWIGDTDLAMAKRYLKRRDTALQDVANRIVEPLKTATAPQSQHETATQPPRVRKTRSAPQTRGAPSDVMPSTYEKRL